MKGLPELLRLAFRGQWGSGYPLPLDSGLAAELSSIPGKGQGFGLGEAKGSAH